MEANIQHFQYIMLYYFTKGKNATEMQRKMCAVHGEGAVTDRTCQKWFVRFHAGDFSLDDAPWSGRPFEVDSNQIKTLIDNNQHYTTGEIVSMLKISKSIVIGENEKCVFHGKNLNRFILANPVYLLCQSS